ncbi:hypothetical protein M8998_00855 [Sphingobacterium sp. lm-10]|uniref:hypothetical protein n=1 Tax=Sphingobacterium sp. lm-10 TaxID=2944904 RepID=UPI002021329C|nr:hypothetical protein [Sphingobacterium sp. lm-10]MCL7986478.1 hypothetical protein [Sphingobacterium sp. lm-10]
MGVKEIVLLFVIPLCAYLIVRGLDKVRRLKANGSIPIWKYYTMLYILFFLPLVGFLIIETISEKKPTT